MRIQGVTLEHHRDVPLLRVQRIDEPAVEVDLAARRLLESGDASQGRRLATPARTQKDDELPVLDFEVQFLHGEDAVVRLRESSQLHAGQASSDGEERINNLRLPPDVARCVQWRKSGLRRNGSRTTARSSAPPRSRRSSPSQASSRGSASPTSTRRRTAAAWRNSCRASWLYSGTSASTHTGSSSPARTRSSPPRRRCTTGSRAPRPRSRRTCCRRTSTSTN